MKSTIETKENVIMTKWKDVLLREAPKTIVHANLAMNSNTTNVQDAKEQYEIERRKNNVVIRGMLEDELDNNTFSCMELQRMSMG